MTFSREFYRIGGLVAALEANGIEATTAQIRHYDDKFNDHFPFNPKLSQSGQRMYSRKQAEAIYKLLKINKDKTLLTIDGLRAVAAGKLKEELELIKKEVVPLDTDN